MLTALQHERGNLHLLCGEFDPRLSAGLNAQIDRRFAVYANASWQEGRGSANAWTATFGLRMNY